MSLTSVLLCNVGRSSRFITGFPAFSDILKLATSSLSTVEDSDVHLSTMSDQDCISGI